MAKTFDSAYPQNVNNVDGQILNATASGKVTIFTAGANDSLLLSIGMTSTDTSNRLIQLYINVGGGGSDRLMGSVSCIALVGTDGTTATLDLLHQSVMGSWMAYDQNGNRIIRLKAGTTIKVLSTTTVTSGKEIDFFGEGFDY